MAGDHKLFLQISPESSVYHLSDKALMRFYCFLLANTQVEGNAYVSIIRERSVAYEGMLRTLEQMKLIVIADGIIVMGENGVLYASETNPLSAEITLVGKLIESVKSSTRYNRNKNLFNDCFLLLDMLKAPEKFIVKQTDLMKVFRYMYGITYGYEYREFSGKDVGQFTSLLRMYNTISATKMIILFVSEANAPSIGQLLVKKDVYFHKLQSHTKTNEVNGSNTTEETDGFI